MGELTYLGRDEDGNRIAVTITPALLWRWQITRDYLYERESTDFPLHAGLRSAVGVEGPQWSRPNLLMPCKFRMLDGDGEVCYEGTFGFADDYAYTGFEPMDDFGKAAGCTTIEYHEFGKWVEL